MTAESQRKVTDQQILEEWIRTPSAAKLARHFDMTDRALRSRIKKLRSNGAEMKSPDIRSPNCRWDVSTLDKHPAAVNLSILDGEVLIGSDSHYWPGHVTTAHRAFVEMAKDRKPKIIIKNGDEADFPTISRHAPIAWESRPKVSEEIDNLKAMLSEIEKASPNSRRIWPAGNHDLRFETRLATMAPEYANVHGVHLKDNFPLWEPCWATLLNSDVVVKHRMRGGAHATRNNTLNAGRTMVTGHLHSLKVTPLTDMNGTRWGVDCGTMADPYGPQFYNYTELNPLDWRSGFVLLTFKGGRLMWPEHIWVSGPDRVQFRGKEWNV